MTLGVLTCFNDTKEKQLSKGTDWKGKNSGECAATSMVPFTEISGHLMCIHVVK